MRALLILAVLAPLAVVVAWALANRYLAAQARRRKRAEHIRELEAENIELDRAIDEFSRSPERGRVPRSR